MGIFKVFEERVEHIATKGLPSECGVEQIACDRESLAGAVSQRACVYSGARVVLNPITDALHLVHGPIGCASYTWDIRGSTSTGPELYRNSFSTDMKELDVIFGGEKRLALSIRELAERYHPPAIFVYSTCIVGIIGDDLRTVCRKASEELSIPVLPVFSEGFRGNKNEGYKAACNALFELIGTLDYRPARPSINLLGEYNVAGDLSNVKPLFEELGIEVVATLTGDSRVEEIRRAHSARLNLVQCSGSMTYLAKMMEERYGINYRRVSFFGLSDMSEALRTAAAFFGSEQMIEKAELIIRRECGRVRPEIEVCRAVVAGRRAAIYMGGAAKAVALVRAFSELGMEVVIIGTQTGGRDDYRNIACIVRDGTVIIDDANPLELKELLLRQKADLLVAGVKERFLAYKMSIAFCDFNHDRTVSFEGYEGMRNFAREVSHTINSPVWRLAVERQSPIAKRQSPIEEIPNPISAGDRIRIVTGEEDDCQEPCNS